MFQMLFKICCFCHIFNIEKALFDACERLETQLKGFGIRAHADVRDDKKPGWKFNAWELRGVPLRIEIGPKDLEKNAAVFVRRDTGVKETIEGIHIFNANIFLLK